ncbi:hypothetical protein BDN70DRAFT_342285 [Pholiota conissans]|uniref:Uncharacterized protein n=1 Tax=Pholiota conissans TaxID=109636 RepID=A0A9P6CXQ7_9AGAR|nr:hypothetical protein BDN70DRAFT_342285 [Pholiota conissans]
MQTSTRSREARVGLGRRRLLALAVGAGGRWRGILGVRVRVRVHMILRALELGCMGCRRIIMRMGTRIMDMDRLDIRISARRGIVRRREEGMDMGMEGMGSSRDMVILGIEGMRVVGMRGMRMRLGAVGPSQAQVQARRLWFSASLTRPTTPARKHLRIGRTTFRLYHVCSTFVRSSVGVVLDAFECGEATARLECV